MWPLNHLAAAVVAIVVAETDILSSDLVKMVSEKY